MVCEGGSSNVSGDDQPHPSLLLGPSPMELKQKKVSQHADDENDASGKSAQQDELHSKKSGGCKLQSKEIAVGPTLKRSDHESRGDEAKALNDDVADAHGRDAYNFSASFFSARKVSSLMLCSTLQASSTAMSSGTPIFVNSRVRRTCFS